MKSESCITLPPKRSEWLQQDVELQQAKKVARLQKELARHGFT